MSGPSTKPSENLANTQADIMRQQYAQSQGFAEQMQKYLQPAISLYSRATSEDPSQRFSAAAPVLSPIYQAYPAAKENVYNTVAPGAGRDAALGRLESDKATGIAGALSNFTAGSFDKLANIGSGLGSFSLQDLGASLRAGEGAGSTQSTVMQAQAQTKASQLGLIGSIAQAAGGVAGAGIAKSDRRLKENLQPLDIPLEKLAKLQVYRFDYIDGAKGQIGVMAQDLLGVAPEAVGQNADGYYTVDYAMLAAVALAGVRELARKLQDTVSLLEFMELNHVPIK